MGTAAARTLALGLTSTLLAIGTGRPILSAQTPKPSTFKTTTQIVRVDAVVVDKDGTPVRGLTADDFEILDRQTRRPVETLEELAFDRPPADLRNTLPDRLTSADNADVANDRRVILVIDEPRVLMSRTSQARDAAKRIVRALGGHVQMALLRTNGKLACEFTKDTRLLLDVLDDVQGEKTRLAYASLGWDGAVEPLYSGGGISRQSAPVSPLENWTDRGIYRVLSDAAKTLSYDNGRRTAMVLVSEGYPGLPVDLGERGQPTNRRGRGEDRSDLQWMVAAARRANVAVYAIDPRGRVAPGAEGYAAGARSQGLDDDLARSAQATLRDMTEVTGGFAWVNSNDFEAGANRVLDELDHYYLLGFSPVDPESNAAREITVRVKRPGLSVRHRQFFSSAEAAQPKFPKHPTTRDWLQSLVANVTPTPGLPVRISATLTMAAGAREGRVSVTATADAVSGAPVDFGLWAIDVSNEKVSKQSDLPVFFSGSAPLTLTLAPGRYQLRLAARTHAGDASGSAYLMVDVPPR